MHRTFMVMIAWICGLTGPNALGWHGTAGLRLGPSTLTAGPTHGITGGLRGSLLFDSGLEFAGALERSEYSNDASYLGVRAELLMGFKAGPRPLSVGLLAERGRFLLGQINGKDFWSAGLLGRLELSWLGPGLRWGADLITLVKKPGDRALATLSPGVWIQAVF